MIKFTAQPIPLNKNQNKEYMVKNIPEHLEHLPKWSTELNQIKSNSLEESITLLEINMVMGDVPNWLKALAITDFTIFGPNMLTVRLENFKFTNNISFW